MKPTSEHKSPVGDDGELLRPDTYTVYHPLVVVDPNIPDQRRNHGCSNSLILASVVGLIILSIAILWIISRGERTAIEQINILNVQAATTPTAISFTSNGGFQSSSTVVANEQILPVATITFPSEGYATRWLSGVTRKISSVSWSPDGDKLAIIFGNTRLTIWEFGHQQYGFPDSLIASGFDWSPDGKRFVTTFLNSVSIYDYSPLQLAVQILGGDVEQSGSFQHPLWSPDGTKIALRAADGRSIRFYDVQNAQFIGEQASIKGWVAMEWSAESQHVNAITTSGLDFVTLSDNHNVVQSTTSEWTQFAYSPVKDAVLISGSVFASDEKFVASLDPVDFHVLWTMNYGDINAPISNFDVSYSPTGEQIAIYKPGRNIIYIVNSATGEQIDVMISNSSDSITTISWSPDGYYLAIGGNFGITIWSPRFGLR